MASVMRVMNIETVRELRRHGKHEEARLVAVALAATSPLDAMIQYETACVHDYLGLEAQAVPFYTAAIAGDLDPEALRSAYLGLGSTYRTLGRYSEARATLLEGLAHFPDANEMKVFLAMTLHNLGESRQAVESLLQIVAQTASDPNIQAYRQAIEFYAQDIERSWPPEDA
jgi:tetratricopeptide (TPR) repeat protein